MHETSAAVGPHECGSRAPLDMHLSHCLQHSMTTPGLCCCYLCLLRSVLIARQTDRQRYCVIFLCVVLRHLQRQSAVLLECLPGFWHASGSTDVSASSSSGGGTSSLVLPANLPASTATKLQQTMAGAAQITGDDSGACLISMCCCSEAAL